MRAIQITVDEKLLARVDADPEVKRRGRSAVFRRAVDEYLRQRRSRAIGEAYRRAYGSRAYGSGQEAADELEGWSAEGIWPEP